MKEHVSDCHVGGTEQPYMLYSFTVYPDPKVCIPLSPTQWAKIDCWSCMFSWDRIGKKSKKTSGVWSTSPYVAYLSIDKDASMVATCITAWARAVPISSSECHSSSKALSTARQWKKWRIFVISSYMGEHEIQYPVSPCLYVCIHMCIYKWDNDDTPLELGVPYFQTNILSISSESKYHAREAEPRSRSPCRFSHSEREPLA